MNKPKRFSVFRDADTTILYVNGLPLYIRCKREWIILGRFKFVILD